MWTRLYLGGILLALNSVQGYDLPYGLDTVIAKLLDIGNNPNTYATLLGFKETAAGAVLPFSFVKDFYHANWNSKLRLTYLDVHGNVQKGFGIQLDIPQLYLPYMRPIEQVTLKVNLIEVSEDKLDLSVLLQQNYDQGKPFTLKFLQTKQGAMSANKVTLKRLHLNGDVQTIFSESWFSNSTIKTDIFPVGMFRGMSLAKLEMIDDNNGKAVIHLEDLDGEIQVDFGLAENLFYVNAEMANSPLAGTRLNIKLNQLETSFFVELVGLPGNLNLQVYGEATATRVIVYISSQTVYKLEIHYEELADHYVTISFGSPTRKTITGHLRTTDASFHMFGKVHLKIEHEIQGFFIRLYEDLATGGRNLGDIANWYSEPTNREPIVIGGEYNFNIKRSNPTPLIFWMNLKYDSWYFNVSAIDEKDRRNNDIYEASFGKGETAIFHIRSEEITEGSAYEFNTRAVINYNDRISKYEIEYLDHRYRHHKKIQEKLMVFMEDSNAKYGFEVVQYNWYNNFDDNRASFAVWLGNHDECNGQMNLEKKVIEKMPTYEADVLIRCNGVNNFAGRVVASQEMKLYMSAYGNYALVQLGGKTKPGNDFGLVFKMAPLETGSGYSIGVRAKRGFLSLPGIIEARFTFPAGDRDIVATIPNRTESLMILMDIDNSFGSRILGSVESLSNDNTLHLATMTAEGKLSHLAGNRVYDIHYNSSGMGEGDVTVVVAKKFDQIKIEHSPVGGQQNLFITSYGILSGENKYAMFFNIQLDIDSHLQFLHRSTLNKPTFLVLPGDGLILEYEHSIGLDQDSQLLCVNQNNMPSASNTDTAKHFDPALDLEKQTFSKIFCSDFSEDKWKVNARIIADESGTSVNLERTADNTSVLNFQYLAPYILSSLPTSTVPYLEPYEQSYFSPKMFRVKSPAMECPAKFCRTLLLDGDYLDEVYTELPPEIRRFLRGYIRFFNSLF